LHDKADLKIQVPHNLNHVKLQVFLRDKLREFDILAYDVRKRVGQTCAYVTVAHRGKGSKFLRRYADYGSEKLKYESILLNCCYMGGSEPLKISALHEKESQIKSKEPSRLNHIRTTEASQSTSSVQTLMTGVWSYDHIDRLVFDQEYKDARKVTLRLVDMRSWSILDSINRRPAPLSGIVALTCHTPFSSTQFFQLRTAHT
jgi:hypothetical protein